MTEEKKPNWHHIGIDLFHSDVLVCVGTRTQMMATSAEYMHENSQWSAEKIDRVGRELAKKLPYGEDSKICGEAVYVDSGDGIVNFIRLDSFAPTSQDISILSHECLHVALRMIKELRISEDDGCECLCYLHEYILKNALEYLTKDAVDYKEHTPSKQFSNVGESFYLIDMGGDKGVVATRSEYRYRSEDADSARPLLRKDIYRGPFADRAESEYAHSYLCSGFGDGDGKILPTKEQWMDMVPDFFEVDRFITDALNEPGKLKIKDNENE